MAIEIVRATPNMITQYVDKIDMHPDPRSQLHGVVSEGILHLLLARSADDDIVGQVVVKPEAPATDHAREHIAFPTPLIAFMQVAADRRRQGVGEALLEEACELAAETLDDRGIVRPRQAFLSVDPHDANGSGAMEFYARRGFEEWSGGTFVREQFNKNPDGIYPDKPIDTEMTYMVRQLRGMEQPGI